MSQSDGSIPYDPAKVLQRAYARIADLTMQVDQLVVALESARAQAGEAPDDPRDR